MNVMREKIRGKSKKEPLDVRMNSHLHAKRATEVAPTVAHSKTV